MIIEVNSKNYLKYRKGADKIFNKFSREVGWVVFDKNYPEKLDKKEVSFLCFEWADEIVGALVSYPRKDGTTKIVAIAISKDYQGTGIGSSLLEYLSIESPKLEVSCLEDLRSNDFYKKNGFKLLTTKVTRIGNNVNVYRNYD